MIYHFTNDTRFKQLEENLYSIANYLQSGKWENEKQTFDQAKNGWFHVYTLYFGLFKDSINVELILDNKTDVVINEFIKKFQYPNPRKVKEKNAYSEQLINNQKIAPLRILVKLLYYKKMNNEYPQIKRKDFENYILKNPNAAYGNANIAQINDQINNQQPFSFNDYEYIGGKKERFITQLIGLATNSKFLNENGEYITLITENIDQKTFKAIHDIITYNEYWIANDSNISLEDSYKDYMQVNIEKENAVLPITEEKKYEFDSPYHNIIYYGAPGTGKSHAISEVIKTVYPKFDDKKTNESSNVFRTTLHPEFSYNDFIGQIQPVIKESSITYEFVPGVFSRSLKRALQNPDQPIFLVLEELSRSNVAAVFGDLFQLLDRENGWSEYSITNPILAKYLFNLTDKELLDSNENMQIKLPPNLYIFASVNTNDQNVYVIDTAFKRRFEWNYISTHPVNTENNPIISIVFSDELTQSITWHELYQSLNEYITSVMKLGEDKQIGQYFIKYTDSSAINDKKIKNKLLQYLWDDIEAASFSGKKLFDSTITSFSNLYSAYENKKKIFSNDFLVTLKIDNKKQIAEDNIITG